jgi:hypothetical protein
MYGQYLLPYYVKVPEMKMLEIGLGCNMSYGPGASAKLHKQLFPRAELWEADYDAGCVESCKKDGKLDGFRTLVGDQGHVETLDRWILESGGNFDVIVDDGGHGNCLIWTSFSKLWPTLKRGGLYFIEDMQVANWTEFQTRADPKCGMGLLVPNKIKEMVEVLIYDSERKMGNIKFVFCQSEACVIAKA